MRLEEKMQLLLKNKTTLITGGKGRCVCITHNNELIKKLIADSVEECYTQCCTGYDHALSYMFEIEPKKASEETVLGFYGSMKMQA